MWERLKRCRMWERLKRKKSINNPIHFKSTVCSGRGREGKSENLLGVKRQESENHCLTSKTNGKF